MVTQFHNFFLSVHFNYINNSPEGGQEAGHGPLRVQGDDVAHVEEARRADDLPHGDGLRPELETKVRKDFTITEKSLVGDFSVITNLRFNLYLRLLLGLATIQLFSLGGRGQAPRAWLTSLLLFGHGCCVYCFHFGVLDI